MWLHTLNVMWLTICIDLFTKVKGLRRKLNLFKHTLCFAVFKKYRIYISHFLSNLKIALQNPKCEVLIQTLIYYLRFYLFAKISLIFDV